MQATANTINQSRPPPFSVHHSQFIINQSSCPPTRVGVVSPTQRRMRRRCRTAFKNNVCN